MDTYDIEPPDESIQTRAESKPEPEKGPVDIWEIDRFLEFPSGNGTDRAVLFSGGDDSLALTHMAMENGWADLVIHLRTNSEIPENLSYVRRICEEYNWPLAVVGSPLSLHQFACRYGFPGVSCHTMAYQYFKGRQLGHFYQKRKGNIKLFSGVRKLESDRRMKNVTAEVQYETPEGGNFEGWWLSPLIDKPDEWVHEYRKQHGLPRNPVSQKIHRSGDCQCLAYGARQEELVMIEAEYPQFANWLLNVEKRTQEYRGRVELLEDNHSDVAGQVDELRKQSRPYPMRLSVLKSEFPDVYQAITDVDASTAIQRGRMEPTNYIGHGGMSSQDLRELTAQADKHQQTLCETCGDRCQSLSNAVEKDVSRATSNFESNTPGEQTTLPMT